MFERLSRGFLSVAVLECLYPALLRAWEGLPVTHRLICSPCNHILILLSADYLALFLSPQVKRIIEQELGAARMEKLFQVIDPFPLASATIAQVRLNGTRLHACSITCLLNHMPARSQAYHSAPSPHIGDWISLVQSYMW